MFGPEWAHLRVRMHERLFEYDGLSLRVGNRCSDTPGATVRRMGDSVCLSDEGGAWRGIVRQCAHLQQHHSRATTKLQHDADARSDDSHRVRCTGRENIGQHAVRKEEACGYLLRRTDGDMRRGLGWQRETSVQHLWASVDAPRTILIAACFFKAHFGLTVKHL